MAGRLEQHKTRSVTIIHTDPDLWCFKRPVLGGSDRFLRAPTSISRFAAKKQEANDSMQNLLQISYFVYIGNISFSVINQLLCVPLFCSTHFTTISGKMLHVELTFLHRSQ